MAARAGLSLGELATALGATLEGDPGRVVRGVAPLDRAGPEEIAFVVDVRYQKAAQASRAGAFLAPADVSGLPGPVLRCAAPRLVLIDLLTLFHPPASPTPGIAPTAIVAPDAQVAASASVGALTVVEAGAVIRARVRLYPLVYVGPGAEIGDDSVLYPHAVVRDGVRLGRRVIVHPGAVIGADGFGYAFDGTRHRKIPQVGGVRVEDDVEIGAHTTIDRATLGETVVGEGTKIDNLVQVGHNVEIGAHTIIASLTGLAGSVRVGRGVAMGGQVGVNDHVSIGEGAVVAAQSGVAHDVPAGERMAGTPAQPLAQARRIWVAQAQLPDLVRQVRALERRLARLEGRFGGGG
jgi:UDP-3-O-[3-hydroxymyristoyl] glucosamine N-acyltransferase